MKTKRYAIRPGPREIVVGLAAALAAVVLQWPAIAVTARPLDTYLSPLLETAEAQNPGLAQARHELQVSKARAGYTGSLDAPKLNIGLMDVPSFGGPSLTLSQMIPGGSKLTLARQTALDEAVAARYQLESKRLDLRSALKQAFYELVTLRHMLAIQEQVHGQLQAFAHIATAKYAVGRAEQQDVIRAQVEISAFLAKRFTLERDAELARGQLNSLMNRSLNAPIETPFELPILPPVPSETAVVAALNKNNPALQAMDAGLLADRAQVELAKSERTTPDFNIGIEIQRIMPGNMQAIGGMVGMDLPWLAGDRLAGRLKEAESALAAKEAERQALRNDLTLKAHEALVELQNSDRQTALYQKGLLPLASLGLQASLAAYQVNKVEFETVVNSQNAIFDAEMDFVRVTGDSYKAQATLEAIVGNAWFLKKRGVS
jgi:cobalt-zinc-cadmium efflux system outer membrane protein